MPRKPTQKAIEFGAVLTVAVCGFCQTPSVKQESKASACSNIVALAGNVDIKCSSLTPAQRKVIEGIPAILNKILANQLDAEAVMTKLDEILKSVNPNVPQKIYDCAGRWHTTGPSATANLEFNFGGDDIAIQAMIKKLNDHNFTELLDLCAEQQKSSPGWLTPILFRAAAYGGLGDFEHSRIALAEFETRTGPAYDVDPCKDLKSQLQRGLAQHP